MSLTPTQELLDKVKLGHVLQTWELEHLYSKLDAEDRKMIDQLIMRLVLMRMPNLK